PLAEDPVHLQAHRLGDRAGGARLVAVAGAVRLGPEQRRRSHVRAAQRQRASRHQGYLRTHFGMSVWVWGGWSEQGRRPARRSGWNPFKSRPVFLRSPGAASRSERSPRVGRKSITGAHAVTQRTRGREIVRPGDRLQADPAAPGTTVIPN